MRGRRRDLSIPLKKPDIILNHPDLNVDDKLNVPVLKEIAAEYIINKHCKLTAQEKATGSLNDVVKGLFGIDLDIYAVRDGQGIVKYMKPLITGNNPIMIYFENFDESSDIYRTIKGELEELVDITERAEVKKIVEAQHKEREKQRQG